MEREYEQKRCKVDNALLFEVSKDGHTVQIKCQKCGSIREVKLAQTPDGHKPPALKDQRESN